MVGLDSLSLFFVKPYDVLLVVVVVVIFFLSYGYFQNSYCVHFRRVRSHIYERAILASALSG